MCSCTYGYPLAPLPEKFMLSGGDMVALEDHRHMLQLIDQLVT